MGLVEAQIVKDLIGSTRIKTAVDLGCGDGILGTLIRDNVDYLIGVDLNASKLKLAANRGIYDELVLSDIRNYTPPQGTEAIFMLEVIEHIPKIEGKKLLCSLSWVPTVIVTTPEKFFPSPDNHVCLWSREDFRALGFDAYFYRRGFWSFLEPFYGRGIVAIRTCQTSYKANIFRSLEKREYELTTSISTLGAITTGITLIMLAC